MVDNNSHMGRLPNPRKAALEKKLAAILRPARLAERRAQLAVEKQRQFEERLSRERRIEAWKASHPDGQLGEPIWSDVVPGDVERREGSCPHGLERETCAYCGRR